MNAPLLWTAALAASYAGFNALALAMDRHHDDSFGRTATPGARTALRLAGSAALAAALATSLRAAGSSQGWVLWLGALTAGALAVVLLQSYAPRRVLPLAGISAALATLCAATGWS